MNAIEKQTLNIVKYGTPNPGLWHRLKASVFGNGLLMDSTTQEFWSAPYHWSRASKRQLLEQGYAKNVTVYAVINLITRVASQATWSIYTIKDGTAFERYKSIQTQPYSQKQQHDLRVLKERALQPNPSHRLNDVFQNPNEQQSGAEYMENLLGMKLITGDSYEYANIADTSKRVTELWVLPSQNMEIKTDPYGTKIMRERSYVLQAGSRLINLTAEEVCHSKYWSPYYNNDGDHLYGFSALDAAWLSNLQDNNAREAGVEILKNRGARGLFTFESDVIRDYASYQEQKGKLEEKWKQNTKEYRDQIIPVFGRGHWHNIGLGAKELAILDICKMNKDDICNAYGVDSILLNNHEASTDNNYKHARKALITNVVLPLLGTIRDSRNRKLTPNNGAWNPGRERLVCDFDATIFTELYDDIWAMAKQMKEIGEYTGNEIRIQTDYEALNFPYMDEPWKKTNEIPISLITPETLTRNSSTNGPGNN